MSKYSLQEVYESKNVILSSNRFYHNFFTHKIYENKNLLKFFNRITVKKSIQIKVQKFLKKISFKKYKTLGIHYRGTSYKDSANHPFPPTFSQLVKKIDNLLKLNKF